MQKRAHTFIAFPWSFHRDDQQQQQWKIRLIHRILVHRARTVNYPTNRTNLVWTALENLSRNHAQAANVLHRWAAAASRKPRKFREQRIRGAGYIVISDHQLNTKASSRYSPFSVQLCDPDLEACLRKSRNLYGQHWPTSRLLALAYKKEETVSRSHKHSSNTPTQ